jgi:hypothetical protein
MYARSKKAFGVSFDASKAQEEEEGRRGTG